MAYCQEGFGTPGLGSAIPSTTASTTNFQSTSATTPAGASVIALNAHVGQGNIEVDVSDLTTLQCS